MSWLLDGSVTIGDVDIVVEKRSDDDTNHHLPKYRATLITRVDSGGSTSHQSKQHLATRLVILAEALRNG